MDSPEVTVAVILKTKGLVLNEEGKEEDEFAVLKIFWSVKHIKPQRWEGYGMV